MSRRARERPNKRAPWQDQDDDTTGADCGLHSQQEGDQVHGDPLNQETYPPQPRRGASVMKDRK